MFPSGSQKPKGLGFAGFAVQARKPKENVLSQHKVLSSSSSNGLFKPDDKKESELYNPFEPTTEPVEISRNKDKKIKKKRKS